MSTKQTKIESLQQDLAVFKEKRTEVKNEICDCSLNILMMKREMKKVSNTHQTLYQLYMEIKENYDTENNKDILDETEEQLERYVDTYDDLKAKKKELERMRNQDLKFRKAYILATIENINIRLQLALSDEAKKKSVTKKDAESEKALLKKINRLPEDLVRIIGEYLPYSLRIDLIAASRKTTITGLLGKMPAHIMELFVLQIRQTSGFLQVLPYELAKQEVTTFPNEKGVVVRNGSYKPRFIHYNVKDSKERIKYILDISKKSNPKFYYTIMRMIMILFNPEKKYKRMPHGYIYTLPYLLTYEDFQEQRAL
jgi:hypothetical protein